MLYAELALSGLGVGSIAALAGIGLLLTYRATGVFNFAHGAIATLTAFVYWQFATRWGLPVWLAALIALVAVAPGLGLVLDAAVFRPLARAQAGTAEKIVASLGVFAAVLGLVTLVWGPVPKTDVPSVFPSGRAVHITGTLTVPLDTLSTLGVLVAVCVGITVVVRLTSFGVQARAVVDRRELADLARVDADRISAIAWGVGAAFAGVTGVLLAPIVSLDPSNLTLLVIETFAVPVIARLSSLAVAVVAGLALGVAESLLGQVDLSGISGQVVSDLRVHLYVVALLVTLLVGPRLREVGTALGSMRGFASSLGATAGASRWSRALAAATALGLLVPLAYGGTVADQAGNLLGLAVIFASIVVVTGYSGQISLGQAGFAGLGALVYALIESGKIPYVPVLPGVVATIIAALVTAVLGALVGAPAMRQRGLTLGLTTLAVALVVYELLFQNPDVTAGLAVPRPGIAATSRAFYLYGLIALVIVLWLAHNLRSGRLGRALGAMRDSEEGARSVGLSLLRYKLFIFAVSAGMAGLGGALYAQADQAFDPARAFLPLFGLFWFTTVVVFGVGSVLGAVLAATAQFLIDQAVGQPGAAYVVFGIGALLVLPRAPGGLAALARGLDLNRSAPAWLLRIARPAPPLGLGPPQARRLTARGRSVLRRAEP